MCDIVVLYRGKTRCGVAVVLIEDAYIALLEQYHYIEQHGSDEGIDPEIPKRIIQGTMTFVTAERYAQDGADQLYTGTYAMLDTLRSLWGMEKSEVTVFVPFTTDNSTVNQRLQEQGYGPAHYLCKWLLDPEAAAIQRRVKASMYVALAA